jgi:hypothetical protein
MPRLSTTTFVDSQGISDERQTTGGSPGIHPRQTSAETL